MPDGRTRPRQRLHAPDYCYRRPKTKALGSEKKGNWYGNAGQNRNCHRGGARHWKGWLAAFVRQRCGGMRGRQNEAGAEAVADEIRNQQERFLDRPLFMGHERMKGLLLAESPLAFRRRFIFTEAEPLRRASMPRDGRWWAAKLSVAGPRPPPKNARNWSRRESRLWGCRGTTDCWVAAHLLRRWAAWPTSGRVHLRKPVLKCAGFPPLVIRLERAAR
jgi:hypothetical protein